ncbi:hypothetical protein ACSNOK_25735 [Streptomyces sp. URMC 126]|uniref:hypothetical protein n=1 Tax=Streptomyces sp. URMC 126 TaxID=3423401 RepID=UPI003F19FCA3
MSVSAPPAREPVLILCDTAAGFRAALDLTDPREARLRVTTRDHAMSAAHFPLTYTAFRLVDDEVGRIGEIQGLPRDWYAPFRGRS